MDVCTSMALERKQLEAILENAELKTKEDAVRYGEALTRIIWNHNMLGLVYQYYDENVLYKCADGKQINGPEGVVREFLAMQAAFPDMRVHITESFARAEDDGTFAVYQRSYAVGTNTGTSRFGPPTGNKIDESNSLGQTVYRLKNVENTWKVITEYSLRSEPTIEKLLRNITG
jgi:hypothetical protein